MNAHLISDLQMAIYWITEVVPLAVTSMLPLVLFPFLNVLDADEVGAAYFNDTIFLFIASFVLALAMEKVHIEEIKMIQILTLYCSGICIEELH